MPWNDRLREAAYTSPSGVRLTFTYEDVSRSFDKKTTAFEFPDADGTFIQDLGKTGRRYPLRLFFWGDDYDQEAEAFEQALGERGTGRLEHPIYGAVNVVPFNRVSRRDDLKTAANQAVLEVTLWETIELVYPTAQGDPASAVATAVDEYNAAAADTFEATAGLDSAVTRATFKNTYLAAVGVVDTVLGPIAETQDDTRVQFDAIVSSINQGIDTLVADPLTLAFQTTQLIQSPARALTAITARLDAYVDLTTALISGDGAVIEAGESTRFRSTDLFVSTYVTGSILSVINNQFLTKRGAIEAAEVILAQFEQVTDWRDESFNTLGEVDAGGAYQQLQEAVAVTVGFLVEISFSLKQEKIIVLDRPRTPLDLEAELYGTIDINLNFLINTNNLTGSEILEIPRGREIVYYI